MKTLEERCQAYALGNVLTSWQDRDESQLSYDDVLESLRSDDWRFISVWEAFENNSGEWLASQIEDLYVSSLRLAQDAVDEERASTIEMIERSIKNPDIEVIPTKWVLGILVASLKSTEGGEEE